MKLTKEQKNYIKATRNWQKMQDILISIHNVSIKNSEDMVKYHSQLIKIEKIQRKKEVDLVKNNMKIFRKWCDDNDIDSEIQL